MFGIGFMELLVIAVVAIVFVGPKRLPDMMRQAGRFFVQMRRTTSEVKNTFDQVVRDAEADIRREEQDILKQVLAPSDHVPASEPFPHEDDELHNPDGTLKQGVQVSDDHHITPPDESLHINEGIDHTSQVEADENPSFDTHSDSEGQKKV